MNIASYDEYKSERDDVDRIVETIASTLSGKQAERFAAANNAWEHLLEASREIEGLEYEAGTMRPTVENLAAARLVRDRKAQLMRLLTFVEAHG